MRVVLTSRATAIEPSVRAFLTFAPLALVFALILLLACANVANMLLARGLARQRELATRLALGADRKRLIRQLLTEAVVLALPAVVLGFVVASLMNGLGVRVLYATLPPDLLAFVRLVPLHADWRVLGFALVGSVAAAFAFGLLPAVEATRLSLVDAIRGTVAGKSPSRLRAALIVGQVTVASLLLTIGGVLVHEAARLGHTDTGLRTRDIVSIELQDRSRPSVLEALRFRANVDGLAGAASLPLDMRFPTARIVGSDSTAATVLYNRVTAGYFDLLQIGLVAGRMFTAEEEKTAAPSVLVSESAARRLWPGRNPIGRVVRFEAKQAITDPITRYQGSSVIGIVRDVVVNSVEEGRARSVFYFPQALNVSGCCILARVHGEPVQAKRTLDEALEKAAPGTIDRIDLLDTFVVGAVYPYRVAYCVALALGLLALGLTVVGVYGVVGYVTSQRIREIGVRIALGARTVEVVALIARQSLRQATVGATIGVVIAFALTRVLASSIQNVPTFDFIAFVGGFSTAVVACLVAALIPSLRAARVDPTVALRRD